MNAYITSDIHTIIRLHPIPLCVYLQNILPTGALFIPTPYYFGLIIAAAFYSHLQVRWERYSHKNNCNEYLTFIRWMDLHMEQVQYLRTSCHHKFHQQSLSINLFTWRTIHNELFLSLVMPMLLWKMVSGFLNIILPTTCHFLYVSENGKRLNCPIWTSPKKR